MKNKLEMPKYNLTFSGHRAIYGKAPNNPYAHKFFKLNFHLNCFTKQRTRNKFYCILFLAKKLRKLALSRKTDKKLISIIFNCLVVMLLNYLFCYQIHFLVILKSCMSKLLQPRPLFINAI